jgi:hypothetical protein
MKVQRNPQDFCSEYPRSRKQKEREGDGVERIEVSGGNPCFKGKACKIS